MRQAFCQDLVACRAYPRDTALPPRAWVISTKGAFLTSASRQEDTSARFETMVRQLICTELRSEGYSSRSEVAP